MCLNKTSLVFLHKKKQISKYFDFRVGLKQSLNAVLPEFLSYQTYFILKHFHKRISLALRCFSIKAKK